MRTENGVRAQQRDLEKGRRLVFNQDSSPTPSSSRSSSSSSSDSSYSSSDRSRSPSVSRRPRRHHRHGSRYSSSSSRSSRSRSRPRCCRTSDRSFYHCRHRSRSYSPYPRCSSRHGRRRYSRSISRSSSRESYYRRSRRSRSRSSSYRRRRGAYVGRFRCQFSPSPMRRYYRYKSKSPECSIRLSQKDKMALLDVARENAAKILGVEVVKLPASLRCVEEQVEKTLKSNPEERVRADPVLLKKPPQTWLFLADGCNGIVMKTKNIDHQHLHTVLSGLDHMTVVCTPPPFGVGERGGNRFT
ncbi:arginine/serine-rich protein 1 [Neoarius graeffei]|uniref:arginine/serine-rich protein 1 n=1 Tax=Neoarius graeffei TaxID=443677 RepID=UPI00298C4DB8|nr:arginine/serine-rich protein 1 [Neoarius graeffei]